MALTCLQETGMYAEWVDSATLAYFDGHIQSFGAAVNAANGSKLHRVWLPDGTLVHSYNAPFTAANEMNLSLLLSGKVVVMGGTTAREIWEFNPATAGYAAGSWTQLDSDFNAEIGGRTMAAGADGGNGWFYIFGGWGSSTVYKTQNFTSWTLVGNLPTEIDALAGVGCCAHNGLIYIVGGASNVASNGANLQTTADLFGHIHTFDPSDDSWTLVLTDQAKFGQLWGDLVSDGTNLYWVKGLIGPGHVTNTYGGSLPAGARSGNNRAVLKSTDDGATWTSVTLTDGLKTFAERHRAGVVDVAGVAHIIGGFGCNDHWTIS